MPENEIDIEANSGEQISDLIGNAPGWLLRSGIGTLCVIVVLFVALAALIRYPDKVVASGIITTEKPPIAHLAIEDGRVAQLLVKNKEKVQENDLLLYIRNEASLDEVEVLKKELQRIRSAAAPLNWEGVHLPQLRKLGMMQNEYARLKLKYDEFRLLGAQSEVQSLQNETNRQEVEKLVKLNQSLQREKELFKQELALKQKDNQRQKTLRNSGAISEQEYEKNKSAYLQFQREYERVEASVLNNQIRVNQLQIEGAQAVAAYSRNQESSLIDFQQAQTLLEAKLKVWEQRFFIKAEIAGSVALNGDVEVDAYLKAGSLVGYVIPANKGGKLAKINMAIKSSGKIELGQNVILKIKAYPYKEYGLIKTEITEIAAISLLNKEGDEYYEIEARLPDQLTSSYGKNIPYKPNMKVEAEIISEDRSLFQRIFNQFFDLLKNP